MEYLDIWLWSYRKTATLPEKQNSHFTMIRVDIRNITFATLSTGDSTCNSFVLKL
jgi:hypothetical protein